MSSTDAADLIAGQRRVLRALHRYCCDRSNTLTPAAMRGDAKARGAQQAYANVAGVIAAVLDGDEVERLRSALDDAKVSP